MGGLVRRVTGWWPRSEAERFADRMHPDIAVGDDTFEMPTSAARRPATGERLSPEVLADIPGLPPIVSVLRAVQGVGSSDFAGCVGLCAQAADLEDHRPGCGARTGLRPAEGELTPNHSPTAGHPTLAKQAYDLINEHHMAWDIPFHLDCACDQWRGIDPAGHAEHVASMVGDLIGQHQRGAASPLMHGEIGEAARIVKYTADLLPDQDDPIARYRHALAERLFDAADAIRTP